MSPTSVNIGLIARREYVERVKSRAFLFSTLLLVGLAVVVSLIPLGVRLLDRATVTRIGVAAPDAALAERAVQTFDSFLNAPLTADATPERTFTFEVVADAQTRDREREQRDAGRRDHHRAQARRGPRLQGA